MNDFHRMQARRIGKMLGTIARALQAGKPLHEVLQSTFQGVIEAIETGSSWSDCSPVMKAVIEFLDRQGQGDSPQTFTEHRRFK